MQSLSGVLGFSACELGGLASDFFLTLVAKVQEQHSPVFNDFHWKFEASGAPKGHDLSGHWGTGGS